MMKFRDFQLPQKIKWVEEKDDYGRFECEPFERGYGNTIGSSLRRILLASMEGAVITAINIEGVEHEFASIDGVKEDVTELILNLKGLRFKLYTNDSQRISLEVDSSTEITGADFKLNQSVKLINPEKHLGEIEKGTTLKMEVVVERGRGYQTAQERPEEVENIGEIAIDAMFSPISKISYDVENSRVGQRTDYDKLIMNIWTDGSIKPSESLAYAAEVLKDTMKVFKMSEMEDIELGADSSFQKEKIKKVKRLPLEELKIATRISNALREASLKTVGDVTDNSLEEIAQIDAIGAKSVEEIEKQVKTFAEERKVELEFIG
jgi:DNA-directed RNA polymerase subunit alpha